MRPHTDAKAPVAAMALLLVLCAILLPQPAVALRASPAQVIIPQGSDGAFTIRVLDATDPSQVAVVVGGDLAPFLTFDTPAAHPQGGVAITGHLVIPDDTAPGDHPQELIISLVGPGTEGTVTARAELAIPIIARIPYPDAYLTATWEAQTDPGAGTTYLTITLENRGRVTVTTAPPTISFTDRDVALPPLTFTPMTILPGAFARDSAGYTLAATVDPGVYDAVLTVPYADTALTDRKEVVLGAPRIAIDRVAYDATERGAIVPVDIDGRIAWNRPVVATFGVRIDDRDALAAADEATIAPGAFSRRVYLDTARAGRPNATLRVTVTIGETTAERTIMISPVAERRPERRTTLMIVVGIALLLCIGLTVALLAVWRRRVPPSP